MEFISTLASQSAESTLYLLLSLHLLIGLVAAFVARYKGRSFRLWLILGPVLGTPALLITLIMKRQPVV